MGVSLPSELAVASATDVIAFVVLADAVGTNGEPPRVKIRIVEVLRGTLRCGECEALFPPAGDDAFYIQREGGLGAFMKWRDEPMRGPEVGARLVAAVQLGEVIAIEPRMQWPDSEASRALVIPSAEQCIRAMWAKTVPVNELVELLRDTRVWANGGSTNFDGDRDDSYELVSRWAISSLGVLAPTAPPLELLAEAVARSHRHVDNIHYCSYASPIEEHFVWTTKELEPFGSGLLDAIHALQRGTDLELREHAEILLDDLATVV